MRHRKHNHLLGVKTAHRISLVANLSCSLIDNGRIKTTLAKARALRPSIEKAITLAKKAHATDDAAKKIHYRRQAIARLRSKDAVKKLFDELVEQFVGRNGGYTRIYKLAIPRLGDAADMAIIEFVEEIQKKKAKKKRSSKKTKPKGDATEKIKDESPVEDVSSTPLDEEKDDAQASTEESKEAVLKEISKKEEPAPSPEVEKEDKDDSDEKKPEDK
jgi:large subunit ribosomal protein L17